MSKDNTNLQNNHLTGLYLRKISNYIKNVPLLGAIVSIPERIINRIKRPIRDLRSDVASLLDRIEGDEIWFGQAIQARFDETQARLNNIQPRLDEMQARLDNMQSQFNETNISQSGAIALTNLDVKSLFKQICQLEQKFPLMDNASRDSQASSEVCVPGIPDHVGPLNVPRVDHSLDELYWVFENHFRGPRELIKQRQEIYLPYIQKGGAGLVFSPVLDLGCGRGEWLELLHENDMVCQGVDINNVMIALCQRRGLPVQQADVLSFLRGTPNGAFGAVTAFHIIEHMRFEDRLIFFRECLRILQPGGIGIFETPNPTNLRVGANYFYFDPSHSRPLPGESTKFFVKASGWVEVEILNLNPSMEVPSLERQEDSLSRELIDLFWGPMDYAIIARKALI